MICFLQAQLTLRLLVYYTTLAALLPVFFVVVSDLSTRCLFEQMKLGETDTNFCSSCWDFLCGQVLVGFDDKV